MENLPFIFLNSFVHEYSLMERISFEAFVHEYLFFSVLIKCRFSSKHSSVNTYSPACRIIFIFIIMNNDANNIAIKSNTD